VLIAESAIWIPSSLDAMSEIFCRATKSASNVQLNFFVIFEIGNQCKGEQKRLKPTKQE